MNINLQTIPIGAIALRRLAMFGMVLALIVVILGAWVRLTDAGLGCPDWPTCYGHMTPDAASKIPGQVESYSPGWVFNSGKAWREMIHRYAATGLGLVIVLITALALNYRRERPLSPFTAISLLVIVLLQGALGAFTVWWLVKPIIVLLHLIGGLTTLSLLTWIWFDLRRTTKLVLPKLGLTNIKSLHSARHAALLAIIVIAFQIMLGGWTSANYAAIACPDLPTCQNQWWPLDMNFREGFILWRGLDTNYTGGVLENSARVAIHFTHRLGAVIATIVVLIAALLSIRAAPTALVRNASYLVISALSLQLLIGVLMVLNAFPLTLATGHNAGAALLLITILILNRRLREA